jgi:hypothetical protein
MGSSKILSKTTVHGNFEFEAGGSVSSLPFFTTEILNYLKFFLFFKFETLNLGKRLARV